VRSTAPALALLLVSSLGASLFAVAHAFAQDTPQSAPAISPEAHIEIAPTPPEGKTTPTAVESEAAPPPRPRSQGLVLETTGGVLAFAGEFRHVAPAAYWLRAQLGYEALSWLMIFGETELAFTDTSESQDESHTVAFPLWAFGGGLRGTIHALDRLGLFVEGDVGAMTAIVPHRTLTVLGFRQAESLNLQFGGRLGVEWYQVDRHLALTASGGTRIAQGFSKTFAASDLPLMWDAAVGLRYAF
jgi:hypothetical protein